MIGFTIVSPKLLKLLTGGFAKAMVIFPFVLLSDQAHKEDKRLLRHEQIHIYQQVELLLVVFYGLYFIEYALFRLSGDNHITAYRNISFEQEARYHEHNPDVNRKWFGFTNYIGKQSQD